MATEKVKVRVRYVGNGKQFFLGVPARDLSEQEFDALEPGQQRDVVASDLYEFETKKSKQSAADAVGHDADAPSASESENN